MPNQLTKSTIDIVVSFNPTLIHSKTRHQKETFSA